MPTPGADLSSDYDVVVIGAGVAGQNAANIALIGFARYWGNTDGHIFALVVMVVAAAEVEIADVDPKLQGRGADEIGRAHV